MEENIKLAKKKAIRIIVLGDKGVGKTSFINRIIKNEYKEKNKFLCEFQCSLKTLKIGIKDCYVQLWDMPDTELDYDQLKNLAKEAKGCIVMFDCKNNESREK